MVSIRSLSRHICRAMHIFMNSMAVWLLMPLAFSQSPSDVGRVTGVVKDPDQAVVSGSQVILTNQKTKTKTTATTDSQGGYAFQPVPPGSYTVEVNAAGFKPSVSPELNVTGGQAVTYDFALTLPAVASSVTVSAGVENAYRVDYVDQVGPLG